MAEAVIPVLEPIATFESSRKESRLDSQEENRGRGRSVAQILELEEGGSRESRWRAVQIHEYEEAATLVDVLFGDARETRGRFARGAQAAAPTQPEQGAKR